MTVEELRNLSLILPEVTQQPHFAFDSFRIRGKIFVTLPPGKDYFHVFVNDEERDHALAMYPQHVEELFWGDKVAGLRVSLTSTPTEIVKELVHKAWAYKAPKSLRDRLFTG